MKEKILWIGILLVLASGLGNYIYFQSKQLEEPIFLDHYIETEFREDAEAHEVYLTFYYLTNKYDPARFNYAYVDGVDLYKTNDGYMVWHDNQPQINYHQEFNHQYLIKETVTIPTDRIPFNEDGSWSFKNITAYFSDGQSMKVEIGEVILSTFKDEPGLRALSTQSGSSSSDGSSENYIVAKQAVTVEGFSYPFSNVMQEDIAMKLRFDGEKMEAMESQIDVEASPKWLEGRVKEDWDSLLGLPLTEEILPISIEQGDSFRVYSQSNPNATDFFEFGIDLIGTTETGEAFSHRVYVHNQPYLNQDQVDQVIADKEVGDGDE